MFVVETDKALEKERKLLEKEGYGNVWGLGGFDQGEGKGLRERVRKVLKDDAMMRKQSSLFIKESGKMVSE